MKLIPLTRGQFATVDDRDYAELNRHRWNARPLHYGGFVAMRSKWKVGTVYMHRIIMDAPEGSIVDHINHDTLDNRKSNLRLCTKEQSAWNRGSSGKSSKYKGVCRDTKTKRWCANIAANGRSHYLGLFDKEEDAAEAYTAMAEKLHGEYAFSPATAPE